MKSNIEKIWKRYTQRGGIVRSATGCCISPWNCKKCPEVFQYVCGDDELLVKTLKKELRKARLEKLLELK